MYWKQIFGTITNKMTIIVGLGNPGELYVSSRHNAGWLVLDQLVHSWGLPDFGPKTKFKSLISQSNQVTTCKPQTFMNESGRAVQALTHFYDQVAPFKQLIVLHDDLDLELGSFKLQWATGPKVHNGLASIYQHLGSKEFWHVRLGIDNRQGDRTIPSRNYVLQPFSRAEQPVFQQMAQQVVERLSQFMNH